MLHFTVFHNDEPIKTYEIGETSITVGRLPENTIPIASISISRRHVRIEKDLTHQYVLTDLNSLNGTFVNNKKVTKKVLSDGDKITIGKYSMLFEVVPDNGEIEEEPVQEKKNDQVQYEEIASPKDEIEEDTLNSNGFNDQRDSSRGNSILIETNKHVVYKIDKPIITIGSSEKDDIFVEGFLITDGHVLIDKDDKGTWIHANKLMGRVKINGKKESRHLLKHKDRIEIGTSTFRYMENGHK